MGGVRGTIILPPELHRKLKMLVVELSEKPRELDLNDLYVNGVKLLIEVLENPSIVDVSRIRDRDLRDFLKRLLERQKALVKPVA